MEQRVGKESDFALGSCTPVTVGDYDVVIFRHPDGSFSALEDRCSHADVQLSGGTFESGVIECMAHGAKFDAKTGKNLCMPAVTPVTSFRVKLVNGEVVVILP